MWPRSHSPCQQTGPCTEQIWAQKQSGSLEVFSSSWFFPSQSHRSDPWWLPVDPGRLDPEFSRWHTEVKAIKVVEQVENQREGFGLLSACRPLFKHRATVLQQEKRQIRYLVLIRAKIWICMSRHLFYCLTLQLGFQCGDQTSLRLFVNKNKVVFFIQGWKMF